VPLLDQLPLVARAHANERSMRKHVMQKHQMSVH
jgi:hypothetical protein